MARSRQYPPSVDPGAPIEPPTPDGWSRHAFGDLFEIVERPAALADEDTYQLVNARRSRGGIVGREQLRGRDIRVKTQFVIQPGDFVISKRQIIHGACGVVPDSLAGAIVSNEYAVLRPKTPLALEYLRYLPETPYFQRTCFHSSVGVDVEKMVFKLDQWFRYAIPLPPPSEQRRIASTLDTLSTAISLAQRVFRQVGSIKAELLRELMSNGVRQSGTAHWESLPLDQVAECYSGGTPSRARPDLFGGGIPWVKSGECNSPRIHSTEETLSPVALHLSSAKWVPARSVLVAMYGATAGKVARLEIRATINQAICAVVPTTRADRDFLYWSLVASTPELLRRVQGSGQPNLSGALVKSLPIRLPPRDEQVTIATALNTAEDAEVEVQRECDALHLVRKGLIEALLSGSLRPRPHSPQVAA